MKRTILASLTLALTTTTMADAKPPTSQHTRTYLRLYAQARRTFGKRAPGCKLTGPRRSCHVTATDARLVASIGVLERLIAPPAAVVTHAPISSTTTASAPVTYQAAVTPVQSPTVSASSGLANCIIQRESGGNPQATNGQFSGIAQWSPSSWAGGGGTRYASSPTGASYSEQVQVLNSMLAAGQAGQWTPYDGC